MIFALGTPINARTKPWNYDWIIKPDALMVSAIDLMENPRLFEKVKRMGIRDYLGWDGKLICDSGAFSAINRKKKVDMKLDTLKEIFRELTHQHPDIIKITLDYPDNAILSNYSELLPYEVQPVIPFDRLNLIDQIIEKHGPPEWWFLGRLVPLMRGGGGYKKRLYSAIANFNSANGVRSGGNKEKLWALGVGAPSILQELSNKVDGCDSSRWRITGSNMILLPFGGERGVANRTKWRGTHHRIAEGEEKQLVLSILKQIDHLSDGIESLDETLNRKRQPKQLKNSFESNLPTMGELIDSINNNTKITSVYELELLLRSSGILRLIFNYFTALYYKI
jgi:hypothetical protein